MLQTSIDNKISDAKQRLLFLLNQNMIPYNAAIVFDIDDTLIPSTRNVSLKKVRDFYYFVKSLGGITTFIITGRPDYSVNATFTKDELNRIGVNNYHTLFMRPRDQDMIQYKRSRRKIIHDSGFSIIMSIGDQISDVGDYGGYSVLLIE